jgi:hypothetical protein
LRGQCLCGLSIRDSPAFLRACYKRAAHDLGNYTPQAKRRQIDITGIWGSIKAAVDGNPWRAAAIGLAGATIFAAKAWGVLPFELPDWALTVIGVVTIFAAAFALVDFLRAVVFGIGATIR